MDTEKQELTLAEKINLLKKVYPPRWRVQQYIDNKPQARCMAYLDSRDVMAIMDTALGVDGWKDEYMNVGDMLFCGISVRVDIPRTGQTEWITRWDTGALSKMDAKKGYSSDSFKRAAVKWGVGRYLYKIKPVMVGTDGGKRLIDSAGQPIYDLTKHINGLNK